MREERNGTPEEILEEKIGRLQRRREWRQFFTECIVIVIALYVIFQYVLGIAFVSGTSMMPYLQDGELLVFYRLDKEYQTDDVVIIHRSGNVEYVKRIAGCGGDTLTLPDEEEPYVVPENRYFVLGDNLENSRDSREFGPIEKEEITGRVIAHLGFSK